MAALGVAATVLLVGAGWAAATLTQRSAPVPGAQVDPAAVRKTVAAFPELEVVSQPNGTVAVRGFVNWRVDRQRVTQALAPYGRPCSSSCAPPTI